MKALGVILLLLSVLGLATPVVMFWGAKDEADILGRIIGLPLWQILLLSVWVVLAIDMLPTAAWLLVQPAR